MYGPLTATTGTPDSKEVDNNSLLFLYSIFDNQYRVLDLLQVLGQTVLVLYRVKMITVKVSGLVVLRVIDSKLRFWDRKYCKLDKRLEFRITKANRG